MTTIDAPAPSYATLVRAGNPGPMTLEGTNSWVLRANDTDTVVVVDPGPAEDHDHLERLAGSGRIGLVLVTHGHLDHVGGLGTFLAIAGHPPVAAADPRLCRDASPLREGSEFDIAGIRVRAMATPGHSADSFCFVTGTADATAVLTGDTILGRGSAVISAPDGRLADYLLSLRALDALGPLTVLPGHGPVREDVSALAAEYLLHRMERLEQVRVALEAGAVTAGDVVDAVYTDIDPALRDYATQSVQAQLDYLREQG